MSRKTRYFWENYSDKELLDLRLCDLGVNLQGSWLERPIAKLYDELEAKGIRMKPHIWLSINWFTPDGVPGFAVPFFLAHRRLMKLERTEMFEVEGGNLPWCMKLLRHETGHALQNAYRLARRKLWQRTFGNNTVPYPETYRPKPTSKNFVLHLYFWYAQSHPAEDFAETFAVWLKPQSRWRSRYADWPALKKLNYVEDLMSELSNKTAPVRSRRHIDPLRLQKMTLNEYYEDKREHYGRGFPHIYDRDLKRLFSEQVQHKHHEAASAFLRRNRSKIRGQVAKWTGEYAFTLDQVFNHMMGRCRELRLRAVGPDSKLMLDFAILLTMRTTQYLYARRDNIPL